MSVPEQFLPDLSVGKTLADRISYWQSIFDVVPVTELAQDLRLEAQEDLDDHWPYIREPCEIGGMAKLETWHHGRLDSCLEFIEVESAESFGLVIAKIGTTAVEKWQVCYGFEKIYKNSLAYKKSQETIYLLPKQASITPHFIIEDAFALVFQPHEVLSLQSAAIALELQDPQFLTLYRAEQRYIIEAALESATKLADEWGGIKKPIIIENASRAYVRVDNGTQSEFTEIDLNNIVVTGGCMGLEVLARFYLLMGKSIVNADQLVDSQAGFFLAIIISPETAKLCNLEEHQYMYIPISGQDMGVSFLESVNVD